MCNRFHGTIGRITALGLGVLVGLSGCIDAARSTADVTDTTADTEGDADAAIQDVPEEETSPDVTQVEIIEPECVNASHCTGGEAEVCQTWDCVDNECVQVPIATDTRCTTADTCSPMACAEGECKASPLEDGKSCDDGLYCNGTDVCKAGACSEGAEPCMEEGDPIGCIGSYTCNETARACDPVFRGPTADAYIANGLVSTETCGSDNKGLCVDARCVPNDMRLVPAGVFRMGCRTDGLEGDPECETNAMPPHPVLLDTFAIERFEVSWAEWEACVAAGVSGCAKSTTQRTVAYSPATMSNYPASYLTYDQAAAVCAHQGRRLCSEAEWEKAARGAWDGDTLSEAQRTFPWGNTTPTCERATALSTCADGITTPVDAKPLGASAFGALNMAGNVSEWVADMYQKEAYTARSLSVPTVNPEVTTGAGERILRGGHVFSDASAALKTFLRSSSSPDVSLTNATTWYRGARCCADIASEND